MRKINTRGKLVGSAPSFEGIQDVIAQFYGGERKLVVKAFESADWWKVCRSDGSQLPNVAVVFRRNRYRFESYAL